ncbi:DUF5989 family protein [uncultured Desulfovibrio sp.]|uniref:DUF5989 family protein n=1 Tax=uncultured Desulfovibrio sp. TaxID=167968 RepID=UPI00263878D5|nr:DUF5989 family protein [uncultured Desulfovibrio sp.]
MTRTDSYAEARKTRLQLDDMRRSAAFGQILGTAAGLYGWFGYTIGTAHSDAFYLTFCALGVLILLAGIACPLCLARPAAIFQNVMGKFGHLIFSALLAVIYIVLLTPLARLTRSSLRFPAARWQGEAAQGFGWQRRSTAPRMTDDSSGHGLLATVARVLRHFARHGQWFLLPLLVLLLTLGVLLFFAQTSVIAPFIYTLF